MKTKIIMWMLVIVLLSSFITADITTDLLTHFPADTEGSYPNYADFTTNGTINGAKFDLIGAINSTYNCDGVNDEITHTTIIGDSTYTVSTWIRVNSTDNTPMIFSGNSAIASQRDAMDMYIGTDARVFFGTHTSNTRVDSTSNITLNEWTHVVGVANGSNAYLYINGVLNNSIIGLQVQADWYDSRVICHRGDDTQYFNGSIDETYIFDRALSGDDVLELYELRVAKFINWNDDPIYTENVTNTLYYNISNSESSNCSLYVNDTLKQTQNNIINETQYSFIYNVDYGTNDNLTNYISCIDNNDSQIFTSTTKYIYYNISQLINSNITSYTDTINNNFTVQINHTITGNTNCTVYDNNTYVYCSNEITINNGTIINCIIPYNNIIYDDILFTPSCNNNSFQINDTSHTIRVENSGQVNFTAVSALNGSSIDDFSITYSRGQFNASGTELIVYNFLGITEEYEFFHPIYVAPNVNITTDVSSQKYEYPAYLVNSINFTFKDEITKNVLSGINVTYQLISDLYSSENKTDTGYAYVSLLIPGTYTIRYEADGYDQRFYYLNLVNRTTYSLNLFLLNTTEADQITATVFDLANKYVEGVIIQALRYNIDTNTFELVTQATTGVDGEAILYLQKLTEFYKFYLYYNGELVQETIPDYIKKDTINFQIDISSNLGEDFDKSRNVIQNLSFNNVTNNFKYIFTDPDGLMTKARLDVYKFESSRKILIDSQELETSSGTILINIDPVQNNTYYLGQAYIYFDGEPILMSTLEHYIPGDNPFELYGMFFAWILTVAFAFIALYSPAVAAIAVTLPNLFISIIGIVPKDLIAINIVIVFCGWLLAFVLGRYG